MQTMNNIIYYVIGSMIIGYFIGSINLSYLISKFKGFDIRKYGSGNAGASNVVIVLGKKAGLIIAVIDIIKAVIAVNIAGALFSDAIALNVNYAKIIAGMFTIIGHIAPFYMGFKGGKGLACLGGTILALDYRLAIVLFILAIFIAVITDYICFVPITMAVLVPGSYSILNKSWLPMALFVPVTLLIWYRHIENLRRIKLGKELKFHFLWNRQSESERFGVDDDGKAVFDNEIDSELKIIK